MTLPELINTEALIELIAPCCLVLIRPYPR